MLILKRIVFPTSCGREITKIKPGAERWRSDGTFRRPRIRQLRQAA
jgi:hypothetical protein